GGTFNDTPNTDPVITRIVSDGLVIVPEPLFPFEQFYPVQVAGINRLISIDGSIQQQLIVTPGQFKATTTGTPTLGTQRLYSNLKLQVLTAPFSAQDFTPPSIGDVEVSGSPSALHFRV